MLNLRLRHARHHSVPQHFCRSSVKESKSVLLCVVPEADRKQNCLQLKKNSRFSKESICVLNDKHELQEYELGVGSEGETK